MNIVAYIISAMTIALTLVLLTYTLIPLVKKKIKFETKKTKIWFSCIMVILTLEIISIGVSILGEASEYIAPAPSYLWLIFKILSLVFLWVWSFIYFFFWIKLSQNEK